MAIVEAAACGLYVVSTSVGGIPEVLPDHMISLSEPNSQSLTRTLAEAIEALQSGKIDTSCFHSEAAQMYSWSDVTVRTDAIYQDIIKCPLNTNTPLIERLRRIWGTGLIAGKFLCIAAVWNHFFYLFLRKFYPTSEQAYDKQNIMSL